MAKAAASGKSPRAEKSANASGANELSDSSPSFEEAMAELQQIVNDLEDNSLGLEASLVQFERGIGLLRNCHSFLEQAEQKIEILVSFKPNEEPTMAPFDATPTAGTPDPKTLF